MSEVDRQDVEDLRREIVRLVLQELVENPGYPVSVQLEGPGLIELEKRIERLLQPLSKQVAELPAIIAQVKEDSVNSTAAFQSDLSDLREGLKAVYARVEESRLAMHKLTKPAPSGSRDSSLFDERSHRDPMTPTSTPDHLEHATTWEGQSNTFRGGLILRGNQGKSTQTPFYARPWSLRTRIFGVLVLLFVAALLAWLSTRVNVEPASPIDNEANVGASITADIETDNSLQETNAETEEPLRIEDEKDLISAPPPSNVKQAPDKGEGQAGQKSEAQSRKRS